MKRRYIYPPLGLALALLLGACSKDTELRAGLNLWFDEVHEWHEKVYTAICALEEKSDIETEKRICPNGPAEPGSRPPPPPDF